MATELQKKATDILLKDKKKNVSKAMRKAGYSEASAHNPQNFVNSRGFKQLLAQIDDEPLLDKLREIALDKKDKRANISAIKELLALKDRYPDKKQTIDIISERDKFFK